MHYYTPPWFLIAYKSRQQTSHSLPITPMWSVIRSWAGTPSSDLSTVATWENTGHGLAWSWMDTASLNLFVYVAMKIHSYIISYNVSIINHKYIIFLESWNLQLCFIFMPIGCFHVFHTHFVCLLTLFAPSSLLVRSRPRCCLRVIWILCRQRAKPVWKRHVAELGRLRVLRTTHLFLGILRWS